MDDSNTDAKLTLTVITAFIDDGRPGTQAALVFDPMGNELRHSDSLLLCDLRIYWKRHQFATVSARFIRAMTRRAFLRGLFQ